MRKTEGQIKRSTSTEKRKKVRGREWNSTRVVGTSSELQSARLCHLYLDLCTHVRAYAHACKRCMPVWQWSFARPVQTSSNSLNFAQSASISTDRSRLSILRGKFYPSKRIFNRSWTKYNTMISWRFRFSNSLCHSNRRIQTVVRFLVYQWILH